MGWQSISLSASENLRAPRREEPMPTYQYRCTECGTDLEAVQKFSDPALTECPTCHGSLRKVFNAVGVVFKGSGFYRTDSRPKEGGSNGSSSESGGESKGKDAATTGGSEKNGSGKNGSEKNGSEKKSVDAGSAGGSKSGDPKAPAKASSGSSTGSSSGS
jgi:putative FmdB family regulatory protein